MASSSSVSVNVMSVDELYNWLKTDGGIPETFCDAFEENYIDGEAFLGLTEQDIKEIVPPIGLVKKILKLRQNFLISTNQSVSAGDLSTSCPSSNPSTPRSSQSSVSKSNISRSQHAFEIPEHWRPEVEECIRCESLEESARCEIVRTLVSLLFSRFAKPTREQCGSLARTLILKHTFMKDDMGNGYQSWEDKMVERVRNVIKRDRKRMPSCSPSTSTKKSKISPDARKKDALFRRYPAGAQFNEDAASTESHMSAISTELAKAKPRDSVLLPLMKSTYPSRRLFILNDATSARHVLDVYPALRRQAIIEQEIGLITNNEDSTLNFSCQWKKFYNAILLYGRNSGKKGICSVLTDVDEDDEISKQICALKVLALAVGKGHESLIYIYEEYNSLELKYSFLAGTLSAIPDVVLVEDALKRAPVRNAPRVAAIVGDRNRQYFVFMEQNVLCEVNSLAQALFVAFGCYFVYNLEYPPKALSILLFFQDYLLGYPDSLKRPSSYIAVLSDIKKHLC